MEVIKRYYSALKPERTYANVLTAGAGFLFASKWHIHWSLLLATLIGTTLVIMSACAVNNCTDREIDMRMPRTKKRSTVTGGVSIRNLALLAIVLGVAGFAALAIWVNLHTVILGVVGYVDYTVLYAWSKRTTPWSTLIGTISGSVSLVAGYVAVTNTFDATALLLGLVMLFWQMPHFFAIGIFRLDDYKAGGLPIWPANYGIRNTQLWILVFTSLYVLAVVALALVGKAGAPFGILLSALGLYWLWLGVKGLREKDPVKWARSMFVFSLITLLVLCAGLAVLPALS